MGACASRPKDLKKGAPPPSESEAPITPEKPAEVVDPATATAPLQDETTNKQELIEPLVDVSEVPAAPEANTKVEEKAGVKEEEKEKEKEDKTQHSDVVQA
nr:hypothetical protein Iba_chr02cCG7940 [Ipomoea batatas]GMC66880.1 hypothetical protein Iba_chr02eCG9760 [Ipomoea batatas]